MVRSKHHDHRLSLLATATPVVLGLTIALAHAHHPSAPQNRQIAKNADLVSLWVDDTGRYDPNKAKSVSPASVKELLAFGVRRDACTPGGDTPLVLAAESGNTDVVRAVVRSGADPSTRCLSGVTPLIVAAGRDAGMVNVLLSAGAKPDARDSQGRTALMQAAYAGNAANVKLLLDAGADPDIQGKGGSTALSVAAIMKRSDIVRVLIQGGADTTLRDQFGRTPLITARRNGDTESVAALTAAARRGRHGIGAETAQTVVKNRAFVTAARPADG